MKEEILKRAMFAMPLTKDARNSGIMAGFDMDEMEDMNEMPEPSETSEEMPQMSRTPQNPEILMNNLRGDVRSVDARYYELAQMVGEEAAMETPPEVLAMLQGQFQQQAGGIGGLPQAQGMMPGGAPEGVPGGMMPGQQPPAPQQPQGIAAAMPQGMEGAPPFSGGAEQPPQQFAHGGAVEPMTPDGMPPMHAFMGAFVNPAMRFAQMGADKLSTLGMEANAIGGRLMSQGFPQTFRPIFENVRGPGGRFTAEQYLNYPTLTQHLSNLAGPKVTGAVERAGSLVAPAAATGASMVGASGMYKSMFGGEKPDPERQDLLQRYEQEYYRTRDKSIPMPSLSNTSNEDLLKALTTMSQQPDQSQSGNMPTPAPAKKPTGAQITPPAAPESEDRLGDFIKEKLAAQEAREATTTPANVMAPQVTEAKSRIDRIREAKAEYAPLYKELLGDTKDDMQTNALLLLADAGFKYAQLPAGRGTTPASLFATAVSGMPQGFMALLAQARDNKIKVDTAALSQAVNDVQEQDKYAQQLKLELLKGDYRLLSEQIKQGGGVLKDGGAGLLVAETKGGGYKGVSIDPNNPTVQSAVASRFTLRPTDNPFVENRGEAPTTVETNKDERTKLTATLRSLDNSLSTLDNLKGLYTQVYGPGAWFSDKVNNLLVPVLPSAVVRPDVNLTDASTRISTGMNTILKNIASANDSGRVAVQEQEWARDTAKGITEPTKFFSDKELAAKQFNSMEAMLRNARQQVITQLGYEKNDYVMNTPNTGTKNDPFMIPSDPDQQKRMFNFLGSTIGKVQDPRATVYMRMPNGTIQSASPAQLRGLMQ